MNWTDWNQFPSSRFSSLQYFFPINCWLRLPTVDKLLMCLYLLTGSSNLGLVGCKWLNNNNICVIRFT